MTGEQREAILRALWPEGVKSRLGAWGILDCARDPKIYLALLESRLEFRCLYSGKLPRELEMAAPQLVELPPRHRLAARLIDEGWGHAWGIFLKIEEPANLRHHLRKLLKVRHEDGRRLLFRYYDPRVLRVFLPTCRPPELKEMFGPIGSFIMEDGQGAAALEFSVSGLSLKQVTFDL